MWLIFCIVEIYLYSYIRNESLVWYQKYTKVKEQHQVLKNDLLSNDRLLLKNYNTRIGETAPNEITNILAEYKLSAQEIIQEEKGIKVKCIGSLLNFIDMSTTWESMNMGSRIELISIKQKNGLAEIQCRIK